MRAQPTVTLRFARRRHEARHQARQVRNPDQQEEGADDRQVDEALRPDEVGQQRVEDADEVLEQHLQLAGVLDAQARAHEQRERREPTVKTMSIAR